MRALASAKEEPFVPAGINVAAGGKPFINFVVVDDRRNLVDNDAGL